MKLTSVLVTAFVAVALQMALARFAVGGRLAFDLVLVGVVYAALAWGPVAGILAGTGSGLLQDLLSDDIVGVGGLAKTLVGFAVGTVGAQFVVARASARMMVVAVATVVHRVIVIALHALIDQHWPGIPWAAMLGEIGVNSLCGLLAFRASDALPGLMARGRINRRSQLTRRNW